MFSCSCDTPLAPMINPATVGCCDDHRNATRAGVHPSSCATAMTVSTMAQLRSENFVSPNGLAPFSRPSLSAPCAEEVLADVSGSAKPTPCFAATTSRKYLPDSRPPPSGLHDSNVYIDVDARKVLGFSTAQ